MSQWPIGADKNEIDTPALCIDLDVMEANITRMACWMAERGKAWRPHQKCHKTPAIAWKEIEAGAIGVTCAKVSEAEVMAAAGIADILIAHMVVGKPKWERIAALCRHADPIVACDHFAQVEPLAAVCRERGVNCRAIIEVNIGLDRVGIRPGRDTLDLAKAISKLEGVQLAGIMGYEGHLLRVPDQEEKRRLIEEAMGVLCHCRDMLLNENLNCEIVSAGGTGSYQITADCEGITELQAGGGIFADRLYQEQMHVQGLEQAVTVLATVVSRPVLERAILDCGRKTVNPDLMMPTVKDREGAEVFALSAEHGQVKLSGPAQDLKIGDKIELYVPYSDFTTVLHDHFYGFRGGKLDTVWPILGRGKLQ